MKLPYLLGRAVFGGFFLYNGIHHFMQRREMAQYLDAKNVPMPQTAVTATGIALTLGGASLLFGVKPTLGAQRWLAFWQECLPSCTISGGSRIPESAKTK